MATTEQSSDAETFSIAPSAHMSNEDVDDDTPAQVHVEINNSGRSLMAILAAGVAGRWSFDFRFDGQELEVVRAYEEGMRINEDELPVWVDPIRERISMELR